MIPSSLLKKLYKKSPYWAKKISSYLFQYFPPEILYGKIFNHWRAFLKKSQWWSKKQLEEYQLQQLKSIVDYSYNNVPYYRNVFEDIGLQPSDINSFEDIKKIPLLTKDIIKDNFDDLISQSFPKAKIVNCSTGGTSGRRFYFLEPSKNSLIERAFITTMWGRLGFEPSDMRIAIGDVPVSHKGKNNFWEFDGLKREWRFSPFHLSYENLYKYIEKFKKIKCNYIHGFVSSLTVIAKFILDNQISDLKKFNAVFASSEPIYTWQRDILERAFKARVFSWYGQNEKVILAAECEKNQTYHVFPEYGYAEVVHPDGTSVSSEEEFGELVGTGFYNYVMPFIRYRTDDWGKIQTGDCNCGRHHKFLTELEAKRIVNMIVSNQDHLISALAINLRSGILKNVEKFQFYQEKKGELILKIVKGKKFEPADTERIMSDLNEQLGESVDIKIVFADSIPLTVLGKQKILEQKLNIDLF